VKRSGNWGKLYSQGRKEERGRNEKSEGGERIKALGRRKRSIGVSRRAKTSSDITKRVRQKKDY